MRLVAWLRAALAVPVLACLMGADWTPVSAGGPAMAVWFDASDASTLTTNPSAPGQLLGWRDKSGHGHDASADPSYGPALTTLNGRTAIDFGPFQYGTQAMSHMFLPVASVQTVFIVWGSQNGGGFFLTSSNSYPWHRGDPGYGGTAGDAIFDKIHGWSDDSLRNGGTSTRIDGTGVDPTVTGLSGDWDVVAVRTATGHSLPFDTLSLDRSYRSGGQNIAELIAVDGHLSDGQVQRIEGYLAWKWGLQGKLPAGHPYKGYRPVEPDAPNLLANGGFEAGATQPGNFMYAPTDQGPWLFNGSGVTGGGSAFTSGNSDPTGGRLAGFVQLTGSVSQTFYVESPASYGVYFRVVNRQNFGVQQTIQVTIDGVPVIAGSLPYSPVPSTWMYLATPAMALGEGPHILQIAGTDLGGGDATAFIDDVRVAAPPSFVDTRILGSFEEWQVGAQNFLYGAGNQPWSFGAGSGLTANGTAFGAPAAPQGAQAAFVQDTGSMSRTWTDPGGSYDLHFDAAARTSGATVDVSIDGVSVGSVTPGAGAYSPYTVPITLSAGAHTIRFASSAGDAFIDDVQTTAPGGALAPAGFNAFESATPANSITGVIHTKIAGSPFAVDVVAIDSFGTAVATGFSGGVKVEILDASDNTGPLDATGCRSSWTPVASGASTSVTFDGTESGRRTVTLTEPEAWRNLRLRMSTPATGVPSLVACSTDNFANRPAAFASVTASDADAANPGVGRSLANATASGGNVHKAGRPFTVQATAVNGNGVRTANYAGTPNATVSSCAGSACSSDWTKVADENGPLVISGTRTVRYGKGSTWTTQLVSGTTSCSNGVFGDPLNGTVKECDVSNLGTLALTPSASAGVIQRSATYSEAGSFALQLVDNAFAAVDAGDGSTQNEMTIASPYLTVGRFVPDHFDLVQLAAPTLKTFDSTSCAARSFTYIGQPFGYVNPAQARVYPRDATGAAIYAYTGALWKLSGSSVAQTFATVPVAPALDSALATLPAIANNNDGSGLMVGNGGDKLRFVRPGAAPSAPFNAGIAMTWSVQDDSEAGVSGNGIVATTTPLVFANMAFDAGNLFRFGSMRLVPAYGSELVDLPVLIEAQYWDGQRMATNAADQCTAVPTAALAMGNYQRNLAACKTAVAATTATLASGRSYAKLARPGNGNSGSVDLALQLGASAAGQTCAVVGAAAAPASPANLPWLQGRWGGAAAFDQNPSTRASFGQYRSPLIYVRENF